MGIRVQTAAFDPGAELNALHAADVGVGGVVGFVGYVRDFNEGREVGGLFLEHYPGMTEKALARIEAAARARWQLLGVTIVHRVGLLQPRDQIVLVAVASAHRGEAFAACEFIMDYLKSEAPFWKKEDTPEGARWVDARVSDDAALRRWGIESFNAEAAGSAGPEA